MTDPDPSSAGTLLDFLDLYFDDVSSGTVRTLREYLDRFPEVESEVAREFLRLRSTAKTGADKSVPTSGVETFAGFHLIEELGRGGQGIVWRAHDPRLGRDVALKILTAFGAASSESRRRFLREAQVASRLDHPGICPVFDVGETESIPWMAMQLIEGQTLARHLVGAPQQGPPANVDRMRFGTKSSVTMVVDLIESVARSLHAAHEAGIVHRDLKPGNIMINRRGEPVILDFGCASDAMDEETLTRTGDRLGTPAYMAPERLRDAGMKADRSSDVHSLGVIAYECLTLERPFTGPHREALMHAILTEDSPDVRLRSPFVPRDLSVVVSTALEKDRNRRYATALDLAEDLRRFREHRPIQARPPSLGTKLARFVSRNRGVAASLGLTLIVLLAGIGSSLKFASRAGKNAELATKRESEVRTTATKLTKTVADLQSERANVFRLSNFQELSDLRTEARALWPLSPRHAAAYSQWIDKAESLLRTATEPDPKTGALGHRDQLARLKSRAQPRKVEEKGADKATASEEPPVAESAPTSDHLEFPSENDRWWAVQLEKLIEELELLADPAKGLIDGLNGPEGWGVRRRSRYLEAAELSRKEHSASWDRAGERIRKRSGFDGFELRPILGLIPLGPDRNSGFEEFADIASGVAAVRDPSTEKILLTEESGAVFVLLPGGEFMMGAQKLDPMAANYDQQAADIESPPHAIRLFPFLVSKFEWTQGQWLRLTGHNDSAYRAGKKHGEVRISLLHPIETVSWVDCMAVLPRHGFALPTEAQWEYACRAGTSTPWWTGPEKCNLARAANVADQSLSTSQTSGFPKEAWNDGHDIHAPVACFEANPFGLYDTHGNVWEWCRDAYSGYDVSPEVGTGLLKNSKTALAIIRGGSFYPLAVQARSSHRGNHVRSLRSNNVGVRPIRLIDEP